MNCHYRTDDQQKDYSSYDPASLNILSKLDVILKDLKDIKGGNVGSRGSVDSNTSGSDSGNQSDQKSKNLHLINVFGICQLHPS